MKTSDHSPDFELLVRERLHALADQAPVTVRSTTDASEFAFRPEPDTGVPKRRIAGIGALVLALGGGFALTTIAATGGDGGESTPVAAVEAFLGALEERDVLGALDLLDPAESQVLVDIVRTGAEEATRVGLLSDDTDLTDVAGTSFGIEGLVLSTEAVAEDLAVVHLDEGLLDVQFDLATLPFSDDLRSRAGADAMPGPAVDLADEDLMLATVRRDGRWYVSAGYTIAEAARAAAGVEFPLEPAVVPEGFDTPEAAATAFWQRLAGFDLRGAIATAAPGEGDALARYAPLWLPAAGRALDDATAAGTVVTITDLDFEISGADDHRRVLPVGYVVSGELPPAQPFEGMPPFDPGAPTLVYEFDNTGESSFLLIPAGEPLPDAFDRADFSTEYPLELETTDGPINSAQLLPNGTLQPFWTDAANVAEPQNAPQGFRYELADGCTTISGDALAADPFGTFGFFASAAEEVSDGIWRSCSDASVVETVNAFSLLLIARTGGAVPRLPSIEVVDVDGQWYVSPMRTVFASILDTIEAIPDGGVFSIDSPIASMLYSTNRAGLERALVGLEAAGLPVECESIVTTDAAGTVTGLRDEFPTDAVQRCFEFGMSGTWSHSVETGTEFEPADDVVFTDTVGEVGVPASTVVD